MMQHSFRERFAGAACVVGAAVFMGVTMMLAGSARADVTLPRTLANGAVLQRNLPISLWGWADPGENVTLTLNGKSASANTDSAGRWSAQLPAMAAGGPYTLTVQGNNTLTLHDVLIGEVWIASGQSNMEWNMGWEVKNGPADIAASTDTQLRMFTVPKATARTPQERLTGGAWENASPENTPHFSAVGYYFARALRRALNVPVGIIHTSWGGTRVEAWASQSTLETVGLPAAEFNTPDPNSPQFQEAMRRWQTQHAAWEAAGKPVGMFADPGRDTAKTAGWESTGTNDTGWKEITVGQPWEQAGVEELVAADGGVWLRKTVELPPSAAGKPAQLSLGAIDDFDTTFVNGVQVGATGAETPNSWTLPRVYTVPANLLRAGKNSIAVRVWDNTGGGGIVGPGDALKLEVAGENFPLSGAWRWQAENIRPGDPGPSPVNSDPNAASVLYNAMIHPLLPDTIRGAIWYQGESNAGDAAAYQKRFPAMIQNWRQSFSGKRDFPFLFVQLAAFMDITTDPVQSGWPELREAQLRTEQEVKNTGMAVITDVGDEKDIHPRNKAVVGERLARLALAKVYGRKTEGAGGPRYKEMRVTADQAVLTFTGAPLQAARQDTTGQSVPTDTVRGFAVAGEDGKFVAGSARIIGPHQVAVHAPGIARIQAVRFGWKNYPVTNLTDTASIPVSPFRTDRD